MKIHSGYFFFFVVCCFFLLPVFSKAQGGNHCAVRKSPFRVSMEAGKKIFTNQCQKCHQADSLKSSYFNLTLNGKGTSIENMKLIEVMVKGHTTGTAINEKTTQNTMPAFPDMKDQEIADVLTYIKNSFGNKASSVKVSEVKSARVMLN
jgi:mono/diheme cytochrome c family protein